MAISLPGDIVLDVARAADPAAVAEAREKLQRIAGGASAGANVAFEAAPPAPVFTPRAGAKGAVPPAYVKFEGMVLQSFLQSMLPDDTGSVYGQSMSGAMWKSMLARTLGQAMAERGGIGIASHILRDHYVENGKAVPVRGVADEAEAARTETQNLVSAKLVHEMQRRASEILDAPADTTPVFGDSKV